MSKVPKGPSEITKELLQNTNISQDLIGIIDEYSEEQTYSIYIYVKDKEYILRRSYGFVLGISLIAILMYCNIASYMVDIFPQVDIFDGNM